MRGGVQAAELAEEYRHRATECLRLAQARNDAASKVLFADDAQECLALGDRPSPQAQSDERSND